MISLQCFLSLTGIKRWKSLCKGKWIFFNSFRTYNMTLAVYKLKNQMVCSSFFNVYFHRACTHEQSRGREREGKRESQAGSTLNTQPNMGPNLMTTRSQLQDHDLSHYQELDI